MTKHVLFEIGLEELPARFINDAEDQLVDKTKAWLKELRISYESVVSFSTPRRLAITIYNVAKEQTTIKEEVRGPAKNIALDEEGNWTKAAIGFTKGQGKTVEDIYIKDIKDTLYTFIEKRIDGKQTAELLSTFKSIIKSIQFKEHMYWGEERVRYARPIRWIVAMYGDEVIPFEIASVPSGNITYGHRFLGQKIELAHPLEYEEKLKDNYVIANKDKRTQLIIDGIEEMEEKEGFNIIVDSDLLSEVCNLVEYPTVFSGTFQASFLNLPSEALITSMKEHQRYFPVMSKDNKLLPYFVSVRNGNEMNLNNVVEGNEKVLQARLSDAQFFYEEDLKQSIDINIKKLSNVIFQEKLGTVHEKTIRIAKIATQIAEALNIDKEVAIKTARAAEISKFDLMTYMVNEFPELQGIIGEKYALHFGEDEVVSQAIREHYLPRHTKDSLPQSIPGAIVSVADKLDTIVGSISVGLIPTGSQDPYGLRRQSIGVLRILSEKQWNLTLESLIELTLTHYSLDEKNKQKTLKNLFDFFKLRTTYLLSEENIAQDVIDAVFQNKFGIIPYAIEKAIILSKKRYDSNFKFTQEALVRILNLSRTAEISNEINIDQSLFETKSEQLLYEKFAEVQKRFAILNEEQNAEEALVKISELAQPIHEFFEHNMVMTDKETVKNNRLSLVRAIANLINVYADLSVIQWQQQV